MKVTPYAMGEALLLNAEQIIPTPEAKELMIGMSIKEALDWLRMDDKKTSRIQCSYAVEGFDKANWPEMIEWRVKHLILLETTFKQAVGRELTSRFSELG